MPSRSPESVENGLETETTKNEIEQSIAVETETQKILNVTVLISKVLQKGAAAR